MAPTKNRFLDFVTKKLTGKGTSYVVKHLSTKRFRGSESSSFYDEAYFENGTKSNYGRYDSKVQILFPPHRERSELNDRAQYTVQLLGIKSMLDIGCGKGFSVKAFRRCGVAAYGVDISEYAIQNCPKEVRDYVFQGDICDLSYFKDAQFDLVAALNVMEHIAVPDLYTAIEEAIRVSKCYLYLYVKYGAKRDNAFPTVIASDPSHVSIYPKEWWKNEFEGRDLKTVLEWTHAYADGTEGTAFYFTKQIHLWERTREISTNYHYLLGGPSIGSVVLSNQ